MAKPNLGIKRTCTACGARFYDLARDPIICPKCETTFDPAAQTRSQRTRAAAPKEAKPEPVAEVEETEATEDEDLEDVAVIEEVDEENEDEAVIEDASELGEDKDDMFEVMDKVVENDEDVR